MASLERNRGHDIISGSETDPLLGPTQAWAPPRGFHFIETAIYINVFLSGFDGTITASTYALISSEFNAANTASWLTTSYLITSTAFQPLYGRFSDILGRRICFFISTTTFLIGCLGCGIAPNMVFLNLMRALTGIGGGGLITMATIVNSDIIPFEKRGMYQAAQNGCYGVGSICGASLGGIIAETVGWQWCFLLQIPLSLFALVVGALAIKDPGIEDDLEDDKGSVLSRIDFLGAFLLVLALSIQLVGLSLGGNELPWSSAWVVLSLVGSFMLLVVFFTVEARTSAAPIVPLRMLRGKLPISVQIANICTGMAAYSFLFNVPLFFQVVLGDTPSTAGLRLAIPSIGTPIGGLIAGFVMSRWGQLAALVRVGTCLMALGNFLIMFLRLNDASWKHFIYLLPANLGQGITYPSILFTFIAAFEQKEQAVSTSTTYLIRSLGAVYGVALTSAIVQNFLATKLPMALHGVPHKARIIEEIRHSVFALRKLPPAEEAAARIVYHDAIKLAFAASGIFAVVSIVASFFANGKGLVRAQSHI